MKRTLMWALTMAAVHIAPAAEDLQPAVRTSSSAASTAAAPAAPKPVPGTAPSVTPPAARPAAPAAPRATPNVGDRVELENTQITGNRELPRVMYVVPWKKPDLGEFAGRPPKSLLDEVLAPVDRDVFRRQNRYFGALQPDAPAAVAPGSRDEK